MEVKINILVEGNKLIIKDNTQYLQGGYSFFNYKKDECKSIILIESHDSKISDDEIKLMKGGFGDSINITKDGWITLHYIILPTKEWIYSKETQNILQTTVKKYIYYVDDEKIYDYKTGKEISFQDLLTFCYSDNINERIYRTHKEYVNIKNLYDCYINFCQQLLSQRGFSKCWSKNKIDSELIYKRDLVWMAINVINYLVDLHIDEVHETLSEAQRIIEMIHSCNGICEENGDLKQTINYGCGCSKR